MKHQHYKNSVVEYQGKTVSVWADPRGGILSTIDSGKHTRIDHRYPTCWICGRAQGVYGRKKKPQDPLIPLPLFHLAS